MGGNQVVFEAEEFRLRRCYTTDRQIDRQIDR